MHAGQMFMVLPQRTGNSTPRPLVGCPARIAENLFKMAAYSGKFIQDGGGMLTSSIRRAHGVRTKVGRLRKHSVLKSDWFSIRLVTLTCRKNK